MTIATSEQIAALKAIGRAARTTERWINDLHSEAPCTCRRGDLASFKRCPFHNAYEYAKHHAKHKGELLEDSRA